jgi:hypothetical protein
MESGGSQNLLETFIILENAAEATERFYAGLMQMRSAKG